MTSRNARRALCLCLALLGLTAFNAGSANAAGWMLEGHELESGQLPTVKIKGHGTILFKVIGIHVKVLCTGIGTVTAHFVWGLPPVRILGRLQYGGCTVKFVIGGKEEEVPGCKPHSPGQAAGTILSNELEGELTLVEKTGVVVLKPKTGEALETIEFGEECVLPEVNTISGKLAFKDSNGNTSLETEAKIHTLEEGPGTEMWIGTNSVEHKTTLSGKFETELESIKQWSGLPG